MSRGGRRLALTRCATTRGAWLEMKEAANRGGLPLFRRRGFSSALPVSSTWPPSAPAWNSSIRVLIERRRPNPAIEASAHAWADLSSAIVGPGNRRRLTGRPGTAGVTMDFLVFHMLAAARRGLGGLDQGSHRQRNRVHGQCQKTCRQLAHVPLPLNPVRRPIDGTPRRNKHSRATTPVCDSLQILQRTVAAAGLGPPRHGSREPNAEPRAAQCSRQNNSLGDPTTAAGRAGFYSAAAVGLAPAP